MFFENYNLALKENYKSFFIVNFTQFSQCIPLPLVRHVPYKKELIILSISSLNDVGIKTVLRKNSLDESS